MLRASPFPFFSTARILRKSPLSVTRFELDRNGWKAHALITTLRQSQRWLINVVFKPGLQTRSIFIRVQVRVQFILTRPSSKFEF